MGHTSSYLAGETGLALHRNNDEHEKKIAVQGVSNLIK